MVYRLSSSSERQQIQTQRLLSRWGPAAFAFAKFIPGLPMSGPILAGSMGTTLPVFLACDLLAMSLWAGGFTALGVVFKSDVDRVLKELDRLGGWMLVVGAALLAVIIVARRFAKARSTARRRSPELV
jgi:membrane protein DedA with SNARE-associated domain